MHAAHVGRLAAHGGIQRSPGIREASLCHGEHSDNGEDIEQEAELAVIDSERCGEFLRGQGAVVQRGEEIELHGRKEGEPRLAFPLAHRVRIRTTNGLERLNEEIKRRTRVVRIFPNPDACLRLVTALCVEQSEEWVSGRRYLDMVDPLPTRREENIIV